MLGILGLAARAVAQEKHERSLKAGKAKVRLLQRQASNNNRDKKTRAAARKRIRDGGLESSPFSEAAQIGYQNAQHKGETEPELICIKLPNLTALLEASGLSTDSRNQKHLVDALLRLESITLDECAFLTFRIVGGFRIFVHSKWLRPPYIHVPLPVPVKSALACHLFLLLHHMDLDDKQQHISMSSIYRYLGISETARPAQAFSRAFNLINKHASKFTAGKRVSLVSRRIAAPGVYRMVPVVRDRVRFEFREFTPEEREAIICAPPIRKPGDIDNVNVEDWKDGARARNARYYRARTKPLPQKRSERATR